jgi:hypothetical protein
MNGKLKKCVLILNFATVENLLITFSEKNQHPATEVIGKSVSLQRNFKSCTTETKNV